MQALEKKQRDDEACGEIETAHPGYLGSQDTFYVGTMNLRADVHRHVLEGGAGEAVHDEDADHGR